jgi:hypothetical protein
MQGLFWIQLAVLVLGIVSLVVPNPRNGRDTGMATGISSSVQERKSFRRG